MPIYEYQCKKCQSVLEVMQKFSDAPVTTCEECGGELQKLVSMSSFALKGSGWYTTDYKRAGTATKTETPKPSESKSSKSGDGKAS